VSDVNIDVARKAATQFGVSGVYSDANEMIVTEKPDVVDICTPPASHAQLASAAIELGAHVLIEKPMATTLPDCDSIVNAARRRNINVCVGHSGLFYRPFVKARSLVKQGVIGEFRGMRVVISTPTQYLTTNKDHWAHTLPGGAIGETGPHAVYMSLAFIKEIHSVTVTGAKLLPQYPWSQFEDYRINLIGPDGISSININYATDQWMVFVEIAGSTGTLQLDLHGRSVVRLRRPRLRTIDIGMSVLSEMRQRACAAAATSMRVLKERNMSTHDSLISTFVDSLQTGKPSPVTADEGREAVKVMAMIAEQLEGARSSTVLHTP
jgi:predicted dehydrogenase